MLLRLAGKKKLLATSKSATLLTTNLVGHHSTGVTETVYRKQLRPVIEGGADGMSRIFPPRREPERSTPSGAP